MGTDKALLPVGDGTLLDYMVAKLATLPLAELVICRNAPGCLADLLPGLGPLGALHTLGAAYPEREVLIVPVDMPLLTVDRLRGLLSTKTSRPRHYAAHVLPLRLVLDAHTVAAITHRTTARAGDRSLVSLLRTLNAEYLPVTDAGHEFVNVNHPADWDRLRDQISH